MNFQESTTILNVCTKKSGNLLKAPHLSTHIALVIVLIVALKWVLFNIKVDTEEKNIIAVFLILT